MVSSKEVCFNISLNIHHISYVFCHKYKTWFPYPLLICVDLKKTLPEFDTMI